MLGDITNNLNRRIDNLDKNMEMNLESIKKINQIFKQIKKSYQPEVTFAGSPIKLVKNRHL